MNAHRFSRKPMPKEVKEEYIKKNKEFYMYKYLEDRLMQDEANEYMRVQLDAYSACLFLPDYLLEESFSDSGQQTMEAEEEFKPGVMYLEQMLRIFPREFTSRFRTVPAFEETLMKI